MTYEFPVSVTITDTSKIDILVNDAPTITRFDVTVESNNDGSVEDTLLCSCSPSVTKSQTRNIYCD